MKTFLVAVLILLGLIGSASAQGNPTCPTRSPTDNTNACASTAFVQTAIGGIGPIIFPITPAQGGTGTVSPTGYSKFNGASLPTFSNTIPWSVLTGTPTTLSGYGIASPLPTAQGGTGTTNPTGYIYFNGASPPNFVTCPTYAAGYTGQLVTDLCNKAEQSINLVPDFLSAASSDSTCTSVDQSTGLQNAINAANNNSSNTGLPTQILVPDGIFCGQDLDEKSYVWFTGQGPASSQIKLVANSTGHLFVTDNYTTCISTAGVCGPIRWGFQHITLDGNAANNLSNGAGDIILSYSRAFYINDVIFQNTRHQWWDQTYQAGLSTAADQFDYEGLVKDTRFLFGNQSGETETSGSLIAGTARGSSLFYNGPTDTRFENVFMGFSLGSAFLKLSRWGSIVWDSGETYGGANEFPFWSIIGESVTTHNATLNNVNLTGGAFGQILERTSGWTRFGGRDYGVVMAPYTGSLTIGTGSFSITTSAGLPVVPTNPVEFYEASNSANYAKGTVTSYNASTGALVMNITTTGGSGTHTDWLVGPLIYQGEVQIGDPANDTSCPPWASLDGSSHCWTNVGVNYFANVQIENMNAFTVNPASNSGANVFSFVGDNNTHVTNNTISGMQSTDCWSQFINGISSYNQVGGLCTTVNASLPTSAGTGGLYICVDTTGQYYKKSSCP